MAKRGAAPTVDESAFALMMTPVLERLQGEWAPTSLVSEGKPMEQQWLAYGSRTQKGNETKSRLRRPDNGARADAIDESVSAVAIDYLNIGRGSRTVSLGIMEIAGGQWRVCMASPGEARPVEFSCAKGSGCTLSHWKKR